MRNLHCWFLCVLFGFATLFAHAEAPYADVATLRSILQTPEANIDLAYAKVVIDRLIDPGINAADTLKQLDTIAVDIQSRLPAGASSAAKLSALRAYLYEAGPWNDFRPYRYDFDDPLGFNIHNKLLANYLKTRKGNCVSMPLLFLVLGQKLGLDLTASTAPEHIFIQYRDDSGRVLNLEPTSGGGLSSDANIRRSFPMTNAALANGVYMQWLTKRQSVALMMDTLMEHYGDSGQQERRIAIAELALAFYPQYVPAMLHQGNAYLKMVQRDFISKYRTSDDIPADKRDLFQTLARNNHEWFNKAEALGWRVPDETLQASYLQTIKQMKVRQ